MGLDTSHDCWHGSYGWFNIWRRAVAKAAGFDLDKRVGFDGEEPWPVPRTDPLDHLLEHSDCDGEIEWQHCDGIADRLTELLPKLEELDKSDPHGRWIAARAEQWIAGLRKAAAAKENVDFH